MPSSNGCERLALSLPEELAEEVDAVLADWRAGRKVERLWARDSTLWTGRDESEWLGWLDVTGDQLAQLDRLNGIAADIKDAGFSDILLLGMGGSSLCPEVLSVTFGKIEGYPQLHILDSTDPAQVKTREQSVDLARTLFIVASKSGSTLEPNIFKQYFFERVEGVLGEGVAGGHFVAITDPGSKLQGIAEAEDFRHIAFGVPSIGGRYSALSDFGMVPAAAMGLDVARFLRRAERMATACSPSVTVERNPGALLGAVLGAAGRIGRDKVTLVAAPALSDLGVWLEQLLAESTGKRDVALIPVDGEAPGPPQKYGDDRLFVYLRLESAPDDEQQAAIARLEEAGQPVVRITLTDAYDLGQEFFRWEFATAVAGSILGINPFDQPDVEASKIATRKLTAEYEETGSLPAEDPIAEGEGIKVFADERYARELAAATGDASVAGYLKAHLDRLDAGDYFALLAYVEMNGPNHAELGAIRHSVRDARRVATCLGYGPRFLHSTGQAYKGGPNTGLFLQITCDDAHDLPVPGRTYTFGVVKAAQARGDFAVLAERGRRALRVHLGPDVPAGLQTLRGLVSRALT